MHMQLNTKLARVAAGAAIVGAAGLTTAVAVADGSGPTTNYGDYGYDYGYGTQGGRALGHRLHCPSYEGMYHSKGHAQCHYAPRNGDEGVLGAEDDNTNATQSQTSVQSKTETRDHETKATTSTTEAREREDADDADEQQKATSPAPTATSADGTQATTRDCD